MRVADTDYFPEEWEGKTGTVEAIKPYEDKDIPHIGVRVDGANEKFPMYFFERELELLPAEDQPIPFIPADAYEPSFIEEAWSTEPVDWVNSPPHYTAHPSGVECVEIAEHMTYCLGNAIKYIWRAGLKGPNPIEDLRKAIFYIDREIQRIEDGAR